MTAFNERDSMITQTRQPFARRHNSSCVYYGIRGDRQKYMYDKSCVLEGAGLGVTRLGPGYAMPFGVVEMGPGYAMPLGEEVINPVGVLWNGAGLGMNQGSLELLGEGTGDRLPSLINAAARNLGLRPAPAADGVSFNVAQAVAGKVLAKQVLRDAIAALPMGGAALADLTTVASSTSLSFYTNVSEPDVARRLTETFYKVVTVTSSQGMSTGQKVLLGVGAALVVGTVAVIGLSKSLTSDLRGARPRRRRRRKS